MQEDATMSKLLTATVLAAALISAGAVGASAATPKESGPHWCMSFRYTGKNCTYHSLAACEDSKNGNASFCTLKSG